MSGYWIGKYLYHKDIRDLGSGNVGTTNAFRTLGVAPGILVMFLDILKGVVATLLPVFLALQQLIHYSSEFLRFLATVFQFLCIFMEAKQSQHRLE